MKPLPSRMESFWLGAVAGVLLALATPAKADWLSVTLGSYHKDRDRGYNEFNYGVGLEREITDRWRFAGGVYRNSYYRTSWYGVAVWEALSIGQWKIGVAGGGVTGYTKGHVDPLLAPILAWEGERFGVNFFPITPKVIGVQLKLRF